MEFENERAWTNAGVLVAKSVPRKLATDQQICSSSRSFLVCYLDALSSYIALHHPVVV